MCIGSQTLLLLITSCQVSNPTVLPGILNIASTLLNDLPFMSLTAAVSGFTEEMHECLTPLFDYLFTLLDAYPPSSAAPQSSSQSPLSPHLSTIITLLVRLVLTRGSVDECLRVAGWLLQHRHLPLLIPVGKQLNQLVQWRAAEAQSSGAVGTTVSVMGGMAGFANSPAEILKKLGILMILT